MIEWKTAKLRPYFNTGDPMTKNLTVNSRPRDCATRTKLADDNERRAELGLPLLHPTKGFRPMTRGQRHHDLAVARRRYDAIMRKLFRNLNARPL